MWLVATGFWMCDICTCCMQAVAMVGEAEGARTAEAGTGEAAVPAIRSPAMVAAAAVDMVCC